jgi:hypothetical protein
VIIIVTNKFGKIAGPGAQATPADNSVTTGKILDGGVAAADIAALAVTAAKLGADVAGAGLGGGSGAALAIDLHNISAEVVALNADKFAFMDATDDSTKLESFADYATLIAGTNATSALAAASGVLKVSFGSVTPKTAPVPADIVLIADSEAANINKASTITEMVKAIGEVMAGTVTATALSEVDGVMTVRPLGATPKATPVAADGFLLGDSIDANLPKTVTFAELGTAQSGSGLASTNGIQAVSDVGIAHCLDDDPHSIFFVTGEIDYGAESTAVSVDLGALGAKATLVGGYWYNAEAMVATDDATTVVTLGSATGGGTPIAGTLTVTEDNTGDGESNEVGASRAILPVAAGIDMASTDHVWLDVPATAAGTRSAGIVGVFLIFQKSA